MSNFGINRKFVRAGVAVFAAAIAVASVTGEAAAKHIKHHHHRMLSSHVQNAQASANEGPHLGAMRYYGGPKSPMWREVQ
jgi:hypothetical protein